MDCPGGSGHLSMARVPDRLDLDLDLGFDLGIDLDLGLDLVLLLLPDGAP